MTSKLDRFRELTTELRKGRRDARDRDRHLLDELAGLIDSMEDHEQEIANAEGWRGWPDLYDARMCKGLVENVDPDDPSTFGNPPRRRAESNETIDLGEPVYVVAEAFRADEPEGWMNLRVELETYHGKRVYMTKDPESKGSAEHHIASLRENSDPNALAWVLHWSPGWRPVEAKRDEPDEKPRCRVKPAEPPNRELREDEQPERRR